MGIWSRWFGISGFAAVILSFLLLLLTANMAATAQSADMPVPGASDGHSSTRAQLYLYPDYPQVRRKQRSPRPSVTKKCEFPWSYSLGLRKCICVGDGYGVSGGRCMKVAEMCSENALWSETNKKCACREGYVEKDSHCINPAAVIVTYNPADSAQCLWPRVKSRDDADCECAQGYTEQAGRCLLSNEAEPTVRRRAGEDEMLTRDVLVIQECLREAGYLRGDATNLMGKNAWTAFWFFKQDYTVGRTPKGVLDTKMQHRLFTLCPKARSQLAALPALSESRQQGPAANAPVLQIPAPVHEIPPAPETKAPVKRVYARPEAGCLPDDLYQLIIWRVWRT